MVVRRAEGPPEELRADMTHEPDRRTNHVLRARIDQLLGRINDARLEIVERGLTAAQPGEPWPAVRDRAARPEQRAA
jgi:hypothetical protein